MTALRREARSCYSWSNGPHDRYAAHSHPYEKALYCGDGSITFVLEPEGRQPVLDAAEAAVAEIGGVETAAEVESAPAGEPISVDEILDLHLYLKHFQGTLKELIHQPDHSRG